MIDEKREAFISDVNEIKTELAEVLERLHQKHLEIVDCGYRIPEVGGLVSIADRFKIDKNDDNASGASVKSIAFFANKWTLVSFILGILNSVLGFNPKTEKDMDKVEEIREQTLKLIRFVEFCKFEQGLTKGVAEANLTFNPKK